MGEAYIYDEECSEDKEVILRCYEVPFPSTGSLVEKFVGPPGEYKDWVTMLEDV